jgi:hypothetical protein
MMSRKWCVYRLIYDLCVCVCWRRECEMSTRYVSLVKALRNSYELEAKTLQEKDNLEELTWLGCYY